MSMKLHHRLRRVEQAMQQCEEQWAAESEADIEWSAEDRVQALRNIRARAMARFSPAEAADPFPELDGDAYLLAYWPWFLANGRGRWPEWAEDPTVRICCSVSTERRVRCMRDIFANIGVPDPFPRLEGQRYLDAAMQHLRGNAPGGGPTLNQRPGYR